MGRSLAREGDKDAEYRADELLHHSSVQVDQGFRTTQTTATPCAFVPTTRRVPSARTSLTALAAAQPPLTGSWIMPIDSDQKNAVLPIRGEVLVPTTSLEALMSRAQL